MKNWLSTLLFFSLFSVNAQEISEYEYVILPENFTDFKKNEFGLKNQLNKYLKDQNYKPLSFNSQNWPEEVKQSPCKALRADLKKGRNFLNNKIEVDFIDCRQNVVYKAEGTSRIKEYEQGYQEAIQIAISRMPLSKPKTKEVTPENPYEFEAPPIDREEKTIQVTEIAIETPVTNQFTNGQITVEKVDLKDGGFMLMNPENAQIIAKFQPSSKANVYRVIVTENNYNTIGYTNGNTISYEIVNGNQVKEVIFKAK